MSFTTSIYGCAPANTFTYTTTTVDATNGNFENLTATTANITNLTTTLFTPVNVNAQNISTNNIVTNDITVNSTATINVEYVSISNIDNAVINDANITEGSIDTLDVDTIILKEQTATLSDKSTITRDANEILFVGRQDSFTSTGTDFLFYTGIKAGNPKLRINRNNNIVDVIDLDVAGILNVPTINADNITITGDTVTNALITTDLDLKVLKLEDDTSSEESKILRQQDILKIIGSETFNTPIHIYNVASEVTPILRILNSNHVLINGLMESLTIKGDLSQNLLAGVGISLSTTAGVTTITNTSPLPDPLTINTLNSTTINNSGNINNLGTVTTETAEVVLLFINDDSIANKYAYISRPNNIWKFIANTSGNTPIKFYPNLSLPEVLTITNTGIISSGNVQGINIIGDLSQNLLAGTGISLSTTGGVTTITNTAPLPDPLTIDTLNSTTINNSGTITSNILTSEIINVNQLNATNATITGVLTAPNIEGFTQSTEYGFRVMTNGDSQTTVVPDQTFPFNFINNNGYVIPNLTDYNFTTYTYTIPISGYWFIGYRTYLTGDPTIGTRISILVNDIVVVQAGGKGSSVEYSATPLYLNVGDEVRVKCSVAGNTFDFRPNMTYFYGYKLIPSNNLITSTTDLQIKSLITTNDITCNGVLTGSGLCNLTTISAANITSSGGIVGAGITAVDGNITGTLFTNTITNTGTITTNNIVSNTGITGVDATLTGTLTTSTITNSGYITSPNANIQTIDTGQNGTITLRSGANIMDIYSSTTTGQFYINSSDSDVNLGSAFGGLGGLGLTMNAVTKDITIHKILTTATINNAGLITTENLIGDISANLAAGTNVTLITSGGITTIASTPPTLPYLCVTLSSNYAPGTGTSYTLIYDTITALNGISYSTGTGIATIPSAGVYSISASVNIDDISINARVNTRCRVRINNNWIVGYPQGYGYARLSTEVPFASATVAEWMFFFNQNDTIDIRADVGIGTNTNFTSAFTGLQFFNGCCLTIKKID